jgi:ring-1,2-phenylacetyl-CoA epoxidase subunit PaaC
MSDALFTFTLRLADNALVLGHRLSEWSGRAPTLEEDIALSNLGLDLIGQARMLYDHAGQVEAALTGAGKGEVKARTEDDLAYLRDDRGYRNLLLVEQPNGDFAFTMVRHLIYATFAHPFMQALAGSTDATLAAIAAKAEKELAYHVRHAAEWVIRLGDGTDESHARAQAALDELMLYADELFETDAGDRALIAAGVSPDPATLRPAFEAALAQVLAEATLTPPRRGFGQTGGRNGVHSEHLSRMLAEMQSLHRAHPGAIW